MPDPTPVTVFLFTDIEGSTRLWERLPSRMHGALARHDGISAECVVSHRGRVVKTTGDGIHAVFQDPLDGVSAAVAIQAALGEEDFGDGIEIRVRAGLHAGIESERNNDFYGTAVNRAARIMSAAHGGQVLVSGAVATLLRDRLPHDMSLRSLGRVRLRDLTDPEDIYQVAHPRLRSEFPALRSLESTPNNLPHGLTSFVGRERELAELRDKLRATRLLTIFGIGGLGKSRLSLQLASAALEDYSDGVWLVELAPVADPRLVAQTLASVLGIRDDSGQSPHDAVMKFVRERRMLLVLDNCEHLTQACAELARDILQAGAGVTILATSRERLGIGGEQTYPLAPFDVPPRESIAADALWAFASVRLLMERAIAARPDFAITTENAGAVTAICRQLDGIPLAIELAAARVRSMSAQRIAERLVDRFKLLSTGDRTALPRQQTLRALIDWSYDLLSAEEQTLFRRLAVFAGGFTLDAAEEVCEGHEIARDDVLDLVAQLVEKSLVIFDGQHERYRMLETVRQYAVEHLGARGEAPDVRSRHLDWYLRLVEHAQAGLLGPTQASWLARMDAEWENVLHAHAWCDAAPSGATSGLRLVRAVRRYCSNRGMLNIGYEMTLAALARPGVAARGVDRCRALSDAGQFAWFLRRDRDAQRLLEESLAIARELDDRARIATVLQPLARTRQVLGEADSAAATLREALDLAYRGDDKLEIAGAMSALELMYRMDGNLDEAHKLSSQVLEIARQLDDRQVIGIALANSAMVEVLREHPQRARELLVELVHVNQDLRGVPLQQALVEATAGLAALCGDAGSAVRLHSSAEAQVLRSGVRRAPADDAYLAGVIDVARRAMTADEFDLAAGEGGAMSLDASVAVATAWLGEVRNRR